MVFSATITQNVKNLNFLEFSQCVFSKRDKLKQLKQINCHQDRCHRARLHLKSYLRISFLIFQLTQISYTEIITINVWGPVTVK